MKILGLLFILLCFRPAKGAVIELGGPGYRSKELDSSIFRRFTYFGLLSEFYLEDFEDHLLNTPFVTSRSLYESPFGEISMQQLREQGLWSVAQSVDADDGKLDFIGAGDSWFGQVELIFSPNAEGRYPDYAGVVITQGNRPSALPIDIPAYLVYGADGSLIYTGTLFGNTFDHNPIGGPGDDTFIGFFASEGISRLVPTTHFAYQIDHLQYGWSIPEPATAGLLALPAALALATRRRVQNGSLRMAK